jgi:hypothetical protein
MLQRKRVQSTSEGFKEALVGLDEPFKAVLEASYSWVPWAEAIPTTLLRQAKIRAGLTVDRIRPCSRNAGPAMCPPSLLSSVCFHPLTLHKPVDAIRRLRTLTLSEPRYDDRQGVS